MSRARMTLHLAALLAPLAAAALWGLMMRHAVTGFAWRPALIFGGIGALSAQCAALLRWPALERRARAGSDAWITGIGMAAITHILFGVLLVALIALGVGGWRNAAGTGRPSDLVVQALFFMVASLFTVGIVTFPAGAWIAHRVAAMRRRELGLDGDAGSTGGMR